MGLALMGNTVVFSGGMAVSVEMQHTGNSGLQADARAVIEHALDDGLETGGVRFWAPRRMIDGERSARIDSTGGLAYRCIQ